MQTRYEPRPELNTAYNRRAMRQEMPYAERMLWSRLRAHRCGGWKFRRKHGIGPYVVDFFCNQAQLAIEVVPQERFANGGWAESARSRARDEFLRSLGIHVLRISDEELAAHLEEFILVIAEQVRLRLALREAAAVG